MTNARTAVVVAVSVAALLLAVIGGVILGRSQRVTTTTTPVTSLPAPSPASTSPTLPLEHSTTTRGPTTPSTADAEAADGAADGTPFSQTPEAKQRWEPIVLGFGENFTNVEGSDKAWLARLKPYATDEVRQSLATVDRGNVPTGRYDEYEILQHGDTQLAARVFYREGWSLVLYVVSEGKEWRVFRYDRAEE